MALFGLLLYLGVLLLPATSATKDKGCSPYPHVTLEHGSIQQIGEKKLVFRCDRGYALSTPSTVRCLRGNWTYGKQPKCIWKHGQCRDPPEIEGGLIIGDDRQEGDKVLYKCREGHVLLGDDIMKCRHGHWKGRTPVCMSESEPLQNVAVRLKNSFVTELGAHSADAPEGRSLNKASLVHGLELVILVDRSSSVDPLHLEDSKLFLKSLFRRFGVKNGNENQNGTRVAVLAFGTDVQIIFNVDYQNITGPQAAADALDAIQANGGGTNMEGALTKVIVDVVQKLRPRAKRALFLMTDGEPNVASPGITPQDMAAQLKRVYDFEIFTVGIGKDINRILLSELASEPPLSHVFILEQYPDLNEIMKIIEDEKPPAPAISPNHCGHVVPGEHLPWLSTVYVSTSPLRICGGVLICSGWVLTAASCLYDGERHINIQDVFVALGEMNLVKEEADQTNFYVVDVRIHPKFNSTNSLEDNLALLKLNEPAVQYRPACLPLTDRPIAMHLDLNINASIAGFGISSSAEPVNGMADQVTFLMSATTVSLSEEGECPGRKKGMAIFCAGKGPKTCLGLTGSPLIAVDPATRFHHVLGVVAGRSHCLKAQNQYVELTKYVRWINGQTSNCQLKHWGFQE